MGERLTALHDELAIVNKPFELERGDRVRDTGAKHRTKDEYLRQGSDGESSQGTNYHDCQFDQQTQPARSRDKIIEIQE